MFLVEGGKVEEREESLGVGFIDVIASHSKVPLRLSFFSSSIPPPLRLSSYFL